MQRIGSWGVWCGLLVVCGWGRADEPAAPAWNLVRSQSVPSLRVAEGFEIELLLSEPVIEKPLYLQFDPRGRLWVVEYRQYPWPAGLKLLSRDNVWRNVYDRVPPPPPHVEDSPFRGADRVTIHEDADRDGTFESHKVFVEGLSLATAALPMNGGVYVLNPPYLLFYADADGDDQPDAGTKDQPNPRILLSGFGIEDSHAIANSLRRGPDGWIYATQGSTVSAAIVRHGPDNRPIPGETPVRSLGQNLWRYHPERQVYEIVAEGGGNAFGVEIDAAGNLFSGHNGGDTRGFHYTHGGYYRKTFDKHGDLSHPFAFGALPAMAHHKAERFTHTFVRYEADELGEDAQGEGLRGRILAVSPIRHEVMLAGMERFGSSFRTRDVGVFVAPEPGDRPDWFSPVDIQLGPDGCVYIADWYSEQCNHYRNHEGKTNPGFGRVYRVRRRDRAAPPMPNLTTWSNTQLVENGLSDDNRAVRRSAAGLLVDRLTEPRGDEGGFNSGLARAALVGKLRESTLDESVAGALEAYGTLESLARVDDELLRDVLRQSRSEVVRAALRTLADRGEVPTSLVEDVLALARPERPLAVRLELAAAARGWPGPLARRVAVALLEHPPETGDAPLTAHLWWLVERHVETGADAALLLESSRFADSAAWNLAGIALDVREEASLPGLLIRRAILRKSPADVEIAERLLSDLPAETLRTSRLGESFVSSSGAEFLGRLRPETRQRLAAAQPALELFLRLREGDAAAALRAVVAVLDDKAPLAQRIAMAETMAAARPALLGANRTRMWELATTTKSDELGVAVLGLLKGTAAREGLAEAVGRLEVVRGGRRDVLLRWLAERPEGAKRLVARLSEKLAKDPQSLLALEIPPEVVEQLRGHRDAELTSAVERLFPKTEATKEERERRIEEVAALLATGGGKPLEGRTIYHDKAACGRCHVLFGQGGRIGPDLTSHDRRDPRSLLLAIVHPSAEIREGYSGIAIETTDGRVVTGVKVTETETGITVRGSDGTDTTVPRDEVEVAEPLRQSLMPEKLLDTLTEQELRDLFAYLMSTTPPK